MHPSTDTAAFGFAVFCFQRQISINVWTRMTPHESPCLTDMKQQKHSYWQYGRCCGCVAFSSIPERFCHFIHSLDRILHYVLPFRILFFMKRPSSCMNSVLRGLFRRPSAVNGIKSFRLYLQRKERARHEETRKTQTQ